MIEIEDVVAPLELCKKQGDHGIDFNDSAFVWFFNTKTVLERRYALHHLAICPAPTLQEIMEKLVSRGDVWCPEIQYIASKNFRPSQLHWCARCRIQDRHKYLKRVGSWTKEYGKTAVEAGMKLLLKLGKKQQS